MIRPEAHTQLGELVQRAVKDLGPSQADRGTDPFNREKLPQMTVQRGVAVIPMAGVMARGLSQMYKACGFVDVEDVRRDVNEAMADDKVENILISIDSPGGMSNGATELAYHVAEAQARGGKPIFAYTPGAMASAAYFVAAGCAGIFAAPSAMVGSIGTYMALLDQSRRYEIEGFKVELFSSAPLKAAGMPGLPLTDEQREYFQGMVDAANALFVDHVTGQREIAEESMQGQVFFAGEAAERGLIDAVYNSIDEVIRDLAS